ncbi:tyrosine-type recombinase/integrase [Alphaproteobacteria bacterium]|nr:tyrosine-type recombinase/integrase [Alphaproteobacteria bacterium]
MSLSHALTVKLDTLWAEDTPIPTSLDSLVAKVEPRKREPRLSEARDSYLRIRGVGKPKTFERAAIRNIEAVISLIGDLKLTHYTTLEAANVRDALLSRGLSVLSVRRMFATINAVFNFAISEFGLDTKNPFALVHMPQATRKKRLPIPVETIREIQNACFEIDDDLRWLVALISDTGMRLSEAAGLAMEDICLDHDVPHINLRPHPWRRLKTQQSERQIPLVGAALWAAERLIEEVQGEWCFPRYTNAQTCNGNSASAALNKWLKGNFSSESLVHGFRHSFRDRLRAVSCPTEMIDQLGGWSANNVGGRYGTGFGLAQKKNYLNAI